MRWPQLSSLRTVRASLCSHRFCTRQLLQEHPVCCRATLCAACSSDAVILLHAFQTACIPGLSAMCSEQGSCAQSLDVLYYSRRQVSIQALLTCRTSAIVVAAGP